jgi:uncharacterized protein YegP (UPF0339 family)
MIIEIHRAVNGQFFAHLKNRGRIVWTSETHPTKAKALAPCGTLRRTNWSKVLIKDLSRLDLIAQQASK